MSNIRQNLFFAFIYNALDIPIRRWRALFILRSSAQPDYRGRSREPELSLRHRERAPIADGAACVSTWEAHY